MVKKQKNGLHTVSQCPRVWSTSSADSTWTGVVRQLQDSGKAVQTVANRHVDGFPKDPIALVCVGYDLLQRR